MSKRITGLIIMLVGFYFLLEGFGYDIGLGDIIGIYWPVLIIILGFKMIMDGFIKYRTDIKISFFTSGTFIFALIVIVTGVILQGNELGWFTFDLGDAWSLLWPVLIIYLGIKIIFSASTRKEKRLYFEYHNHGKKIKFNRKNIWIGEANYGIDDHSWNLEDMQLWHGIGESKIDLTTAIIPDREVILDISGLVGEITVYVPQNLAIKVNCDVKVGDVTLFNHNQSGTGRFISYVSDNYEEAIQKVNLMVTLKVGEVTVKRVD